MREICIAPGTEVDFLALCIAINMATAYIDVILRCCTGPNRLSLPQQYIDSDESVYRVHEAFDTAICKICNCTRHASKVFAFLCAVAAYFNGFVSSLALGWKFIFAIAPLLICVSATVLLVIVRLGVTGGIVLLHWRRLSAKPTTCPTTENAEALMSEITMLEATREVHNEQSGNL